MRFRPALLAGGLAALVVPTAVVPAAATSTPTLTLRSVAPADLAPWDPAISSAPSTRWFVLPGDQKGQGAYSFVPPAGLGQVGGLRLSAPSAGDRITVMTQPPAGVTTANVDFYASDLRPDHVVTQLVADLDGNGSASGGEVRATLVGSYYLNGGASVVLDRDVHSDGTTGPGSGSVAFPAGQQTVLHDLAAVCPTVLRLGLQAKDGAVGTLPTATEGQSLSSGTIDIFRATEPGGSPAVRLGGRDRIATALAVASHVAPGRVSTAILAGSAAFPDSVVGSGLAQAKQAPLLLNPTGGLDARVASFLRQHVKSGGQVILLGGTGALSATVDTQVKSLGFTTLRYGGADRFQTAVAVASHMRDGRCGGEYSFPYCGVTLVDGTNFPDAISGSRLGEPVLYTFGRKVPAVTAAYVAQSSPIDPHWAVGGSAAAAAATLPRRSYSFVDLVGADRYATSALALAQSTFDRPLIALASGESFPDALVGSTLAPVLLTRPTSLPSATAQALTAHAPLVDPLVVLGTSDVTSDSMVAAAQKALAAGQVTTGPGNLPY
ncbi:MAG: cell wall-binding repeat-containing protein [Motilibacteraceae bacterium]